MRFWLRELAGWLLVGLGLYVFLIVTLLLLDPEIGWPQFVQAGPLIVIGFIVFRGGIHLLKVAVAARVCMQAQAEMNRRQHEPARRPVRPAPWEEV
jgi:hypothetical protein